MEYEGRGEKTPLFSLTHFDKYFTKNHKEENLYLSLSCPRKLFCYSKHCVSAILQYVAPHTALTAKPSVRFFLLQVTGGLRGWWGVRGGGISTLRYNFGLLDTGKWKNSYVRAHRFESRPFSLPPPPEKGELYGSRDLANSVKGSLTREFWLQVFLNKSLYPWPLSIPLGPFQIFTKFRGDIRK